MLMLHLPCWGNPIPGSLCIKSSFAILLPSHAGPGTSSLLVLRMKSRFTIPRHNWPQFNCLSCSSCPQSVPISLDQTSVSCNSPVDHKHWILAWLITSASEIAPINPSGGGNGVPRVVVVTSCSNTCLLMICPEHIYNRLKNDTEPPWTPPTCFLTSMIYHSEASNYSLSLLLPRPAEAQSQSLGQGPPSS